MPQLTQQQYRILDYIQRHIFQEGYPPTRIEIARAFKFRSPNAAQDHIDALSRKGFIAVKPGTARGIKVLRWSDKGSL